MISLGEIERMDTVYINATEVGGSAWVENPRKYFIRDGILKPGRNVIATRVLKTKPDGGFLSKPEDLISLLATRPAFRSRVSGRPNSASTRVHSNLANCL